MSAANKTTVCQLPFKSQARISLFLSMFSLNIPFYKWCTKEYFVLKPFATVCSHNDDLVENKLIQNMSHDEQLRTQQFLHDLFSEKVLNLQASSIISTLNQLLLLNAWWSDAPNDAKLAYASLGNLWNRVEEKVGLKIFWIHIYMVIFSTLSSE